MKLSVTALALLAAAAPSVLAGLEDAKYSTVLSPDNFDGVIASQSEGTLVAFFAPWCGHCKTLEPVWTKIAAAFDGDDRCKVAHLNADDASARPIASKYGVSGFPTIKFIAPPSQGGKVDSYAGPRTEEAFLAYLNEKCGTHKLSGGLLSDLAGRIPSLDNLASLYLAPTATRPSLLASASALASSLTSPEDGSPLAAYYVKVMSKVDSFGDDLDSARAWVDKERVRLGKLAAKKGQVAAKKLDEARMKENILQAFADTRTVAAEAQASVSSAASVAGATASSAGSVVAQSASSASSVASRSASSASSVAAKSAVSASSVASDSASSVYGRASESAESVAAEVKETARHVVDRVGGEL
ncbi:hypothetical protein JCM8202_001188 [Rhodotorula sphaerocarpa]